MNILVSSCLLGLDCRYSGNNCFSESVAALSRQHNLIPVCPEQMGGLPTPRPPLERVGRRVKDKDGQDFTSAMEKGAAETMKIAVLLSCTHAVLKSGSPSCGSGFIYDGTFSGHKIEGNGILTEKLLAGVIAVTDEDHLDGFIN